MGRHSTGAWTVGECLRIELSYLLRHDFIKKGYNISFSLNWTDQHGRLTGSASFQSCYTNKDKFLQISYTVTESNENKIDYCYKVYLIEQDSNLGRGKVLYFICPQTGLKCRILYKAYGSHKFKSRLGYSYRIYYCCQQSSKLSRYNDNYWKLEGLLEKLRKITCNGKRTYKEKLSRKAQRYNWLVLKQRHMDNLRWTLGVPKAVRGRIKDFF